MAEHGVRTADGAQIATPDTHPAKPTPVSEDELQQRGEITPMPSGSTSARCRDSVGTRSHPMTERSATTSRSGTPL